MSSSSSTTKPLSTEELFVTCSSHVEPYLIKELKTLGILKVRQGFRGVYAPRTMENVYLVNYASRMATRVLWPIMRFPCPHREALYRAAYSIDWSRYLEIATTFSIDANIDQHPHLRNSHFATLIVKDAICDQFRHRTGSRPSVQRMNPDVQIHLFLHRGIATLSFDTSGLPLYKRGWRSDSTEAPLQESLAAVLLAASNYDPDHDILCDPFCGSGTLLIEAAMVASRTPPGFFRTTWGFFRMPEFSNPAWTATRHTFDRRRTTLATGRFFGSDQDRCAISITRRHARTLGFSSAITVVEAPLHQLTLPCAPTLILTNPPYGHRLPSSTNTYSPWPRFLQQFPHARAFALQSEARGDSFTNLVTRPILRCSHGGIPTALLSLKLPQKNP